MLVSRIGSSNNNGARKALITSIGRKLLPLWWKLNVHRVNGMETIRVSLVITFIYLFSFDRRNNSTCLKKKKSINYSSTRFLSRTRLLFVVIFQISVIIKKFTTSLFIYWKCKFYFNNLSRVSRISLTSRTIVYVVEVKCCR